MYFSPGGQEAGVSVGILSGAAAGVIWLVRMVRLRRSRGAGILRGTWLGLVLGTASSFMVHLSLLLVSEFPIAGWATSELPIGLLFGVAAGVAIGLVCSLGLVVAMPD